MMKETKMMRKRWKVYNWLSSIISFHKLLFKVKFAFHPHHWKSKCFNFWSWTERKSCSIQVRWPRALCWRVISSNVSINAGEAEGLELEVKLIRIYDIGERGILTSETSIWTLEFIMQKLPSANQKEFKKFQKVSKKKIKKIKKKKENFQKKNNPAPPQPGPSRPDLAGPNQPFQRRRPFIYAKNLLLETMSRTFVHIYRSETEVRFSHTNWYKTTN